MSKAGQPVLLADIGGTNARFALADNGDIQQTGRLLVADYAGLSAAIRDFLDQAKPEITPQRAALAIAGPVAKGRAQLTNGSWRVSESGLRRELAMDSVSLVNEFAAVLISLLDCSVAAVVLRSSPRGSRDRASGRSSRNRELRPKSSAVSSSRE